MAKTIPGGAYQNADGTWHDANGKRIKAPAKVYFRDEEELHPVMSIVGTTEDEFGDSPDMIPQEGKNEELPEPIGIRKSRKKSK